MNDTVLRDALALRRSGRLAEATAIYREILREEPEHFEALHALGILRYQAGALDEAERLIGRAVQVNPKAAEAFYNRGSLLLKLNRPEEALGCFESAIAIKPDYAEALGNRGNALMQLGKYASALADFTELVRLKPGLAGAWINQGGALSKLGRFSDAWESYDRALVLQPDNADTRMNRGAIALTLGRFEEALVDADRLLVGNHGNAAFWELRANALAELGRRDAAAESFGEALRLNPAHAQTLLNRADNLMALRRFEEAAQGFASTLRIAPDFAYARGANLFCRLCTCDWENLSEDIAALREDMRRGVPVAPFHALVITPDPTEIHSAAKAFSAQKFPPAPEPLWKGEIYTHDRIRIAYLSANFNDHAVARLMAGAFEHHDHNRFETHAVSFGPSDDGPMGMRLAQAFDRFLNVRTESAGNIAHRMRQMEIDIAIDLMGFTEGCRPAILGHRPAPVQVNYLGYAGTMGAEYLDYIIADSTVIPLAQCGDYTERVVHMPHTYLPGDRARAISHRLPSRAEAGLPEKGFVFCCFNHAYKLTPPVFDIWMSLLRQVDGSVLWLSHMASGAAANLKREAEARGVSASQLIFAEFAARDADHLARLKLADLFLDTLPYNAHATANDALWAGVPVLTMAGQGFAGRVAASLLQAIGMAELITSSPDAYEALALKLARDRAALESIKTKLLSNRENWPLFDTARFTRDLENAYVTMWERSQRGLPPLGFTVAGAP